MRVALACAALALWASAAIAAGPSATEIKAAARDGRKALQERLKDPESMRLRKLFVSALKVETDQGNAIDLLYLCGEINAKNSHGGYVGFRRFTASSAGATIAESDSDAAFEEITWQRRCSRKLRDVR